MNFKVDFDILMGLRGRSPTSMRHGHLDVGENFALFKTNDRTSTTELRGVIQQLASCYDEFKAYHPEFTREFTYPAHNQALVARVLTEFVRDILLVVRRAEDVYDDSEKREYGRWLSMNSHKMKSNAYESMVQFYAGMQLNYSTKMMTMDNFKEPREFWHEYIGLKAATTMRGDDVWVDNVRIIE